MLTTGKGAHYCKHCGFDMRVTEQRECPACDGDCCEPKKRTAVKKTAQRKPNTRIPKTSARKRERIFYVGASVRILSGPNKGRIGQVYDVGANGIYESKVQLDGDAAGAWWKNGQLALVAAPVDSTDDANAAAATPETESTTAVTIEKIRADERAKLVAWMRTIGAGAFDVVADAIEVNFPILKV